MRKLQIYDPLINRIPEQCMCVGWLPGTIGREPSLRASGRTVSRSGLPSFRGSWSDDAQILSWEGGELDATILT